MRQETVNIYTFDELSDEAKERARDWYREGEDFGWILKEASDSVKEFNKIAPVIISDADYYRQYVKVKWDYDSYYDGEEDLEGREAWVWLKKRGWFAIAKENSDGGCTLTGVCYDCPLFDPITEVAKTPQKVPSLMDLFRECAERWMDMVVEDIEHQSSDESIDENIWANGYEFYGDGEFYQ